MNDHNPSVSVHGSGLTVRFTMAKLSFGILGLRVSTEENTIPNVHMRLHRFPPTAGRVREQLGIPFAITSCGKCRDGSEEQEQ
jgi:hypothetical protein